ncbi:adenine-specific DNA methylase [Hamadaea flava]|uniref:DNA methyltransferase n=1 Tax=Hamadaea flava TaxID=1742688 RepID=A0ABV8LLD0_9ACTN|nr:DNA methyltransferase [Hamadaea flava]MCP2325247.1 adenine-specific DNA methylase [Hamadaea flava]
MAAYGSLNHRPDVVVLDPFAGSGATLVEAAKMGCRVIGYDINPVATLVQRQALAEWDHEALAEAFKDVESRVKAEIDSLHMTKDGEHVLYYLWVSTVACPLCPGGAPPIELFSRYIFAQHAYPKRYPAAQATCPQCHAVVAVDLSADTRFTCHDCRWSGSFDGPVAGATMTCSAGHRTKIIDALGGQPPRQRMYAKLVLTLDGGRRYDPIGEFDEQLYSRAEQLLTENADKIVMPCGRLDSGYNTRQALSWGYREWRQFFNARQLYSLGLLGAAVRDLPISPEREALAALFSGVLEFNNLF